jgi:hypothetical protein
MTKSTIHPLKLRAIRLTRQPVPAPPCGPGAVRRAVLRGAIIGGLASLLVSLVVALLTGCVPWPPEQSLASAKEIPFEAICLGAAILLIVVVIGYLATEHYLKGLGK